MKKSSTIFAFLLLVILGKAQVSFKTIVPQQPVVSGESFQVQYILEDAEKGSNFKPPVFTNFRFVAGPNIYKGAVAGLNGTKQLRNFVYTLEAERPGRFIIPGATVMVNGNLIRSNDVMVEVISKDDAIKQFNKISIADNSDYFLRPGEDVYEKIRRNLFVKVMVDRKSCFVGEPVLASFKLYSRLESKSDIVKNPGFYGFTVYDMVNLADKQVAAEKVNGKIFDVHTIRKVQLYPLQPGVFTIDEMQVKNRVEFSRSAVNKKTEQRIVEGVLGQNDDELPAEGTEVFETDINSAPVSINVKPVPEKNRPLNFDGAAGHFNVVASLIKNNLSKNEEGFLEIIINGKGNFTQISAPSVQWPAGIESFEPTVKDNLDKTTVPLTGSRTFRYPFVCAAAGAYQMQPVSISFFDTDSSMYKTASSVVLQLTVSNEEKHTVVKEEKKESIAESNARASKTAAGIVILAVIVVLLYWIAHKKPPAPVIKEQKTVTIPVDEILQPASLLTSATDKEFYTALHQSVWNYFSTRLGLQGSEMNKENLVVRLQQKNIPENLINKLRAILTECETGMFINASLVTDKNGLLQQTKDILESIDPLVSE
jgi:BatD DUF11 like domain